MIQGVHLCTRRVRRKVTSRVATPKAHPQMTPLSELERRDALIRIGTELGRQRMEDFGAGADLLASLIATAIVEADVQLTKREV